MNSTLTRISEWRIQIWKVAWLCNRGIFLAKSALLQETTSYLLEFSQNCLTQFRLGFEWYWKNSSPSKQVEKCDFSIGDNLDWPNRDVSWSEVLPLTARCPIFKCQRNKEQCLLQNSVLQIWRKKKKSAKGVLCTQCVILWKSDKRGSGAFNSG